MQDPRRPPRFRFHLAVVVVIAAVFVATALRMHRLGVSERTFGDARPLVTGPIRVAHTTGELYSLWKLSGYRGRQVVYLSRFLHFVEPPPPAELVRVTAFPVKTFSLLSAWEKGVDAKNVLWLAQRAGIARGVYHVLPAAELEERLAGVRRGTPGVRVEGRRIYTHELGSPRLVSDELPELAEPVLFAVDASYLQLGTPGEVLRRLRESRLLSELVILCRSEDNPDVEAADRRRLDELATALGAVS